MLELLKKLNDQFVNLEEHINWQLFVTILSVPFNKPECINKMGRLPYDWLIVFKILVLQILYKFSDDNMEYQIIERMSFTRLLCSEVK